MRPYRLLFEHALSRVDPEQAHEWAFRAIRTAGPVTARTVPPLRGRHRVLGLEFPGLLGLAAGFDKDARGVDALAALGFGSVEIGTVTARPQPGNPRPRLARLTADRAVVNRMGFNNSGAEAVARRLSARPARGRRERRAPLGVNIGKSRVVPEHDAEAVSADHRFTAGLLAPYADYLVVNVSSPNTPGLRDLQSVERLEPLLAGVRRRADEVTQDRGRPVPLLVKVAPDLADEDLLAVADLAVASGLDGIVATNTTIARDGLRSTADQIAEAGGGGLSGAPLRARAVEVLRLLRGRVGGRLALVGVGGIGSVEDARERLAAGADLLQAYTAFAYEGPWWPLQVNRALERRPAEEESVRP